jgi:GT2 family glycosyltransferase
VREGKLNSGEYLVEIVCATRLSKVDFHKSSALGISLQRLGYDRRLIAHVKYENKAGLPAVYNEAISAGNSQNVLVFMHDDIWIDDFFFADRVIDGLQKYDVIGVAGNKRRVKNQPAWAFIDLKFTHDDRSNLSGSVAHGKNPFGPVSFFGPVPADCELLDGVLIAAKRATLISHGVRFDPQFDFHFYDMDFCRSARAMGLRLGTAAVCLTHQSMGAFGTSAWAKNYFNYIRKWVD